MKTHYQGLVERELKQWGVKIDPRALEGIDDIYLEERRRQIFDVAMYRLINLTFAILGIGIWLILRGTVFEVWFFISLLIFFTILNGTLFIAGLIKYIKLKSLNKSHE